MRRRTLDSALLESSGPGSGQMVAGRFLFILVIIVIACAVPATQFCDTCNSQAAQECIVQKQQQICSYSCDADFCSKSGSCQYICCDGALPHVFEYETQVKYYGFDSEVGAGH